MRMNRMNPYQLEEKQEQEVGGQETTNQVF
jgi:hypothetical protein